MTFWPANLEPSWRVRLVGGVSAFAENEHFLGEDAGEDGAESGEAGGDYVVGGFGEGPDGPGYGGDAGVGHCVGLEEDA